eukprot:360883-Chlamydomonas_euryale.AAC.2
MAAHERRRAELLSKQQRKIDELNERTEALTRQKLESEVAWVRRQRDIELQKAREERAMEVRRRG